jgi:hypothetical protein
VISSNRNSEHSNWYVVYIFLQPFFSNKIGVFFTGDGDVIRKIPIPIYMVFPRLFACPTLSTPNFKIGKNVYPFFLCVGLKTDS